MTRVFDRQHTWKSTKGSLSKGGWLICTHKHAASTPDMAWYREREWKRKRKLTFFNTHINVYFVQNIFVEPFYWCITVCISVSFFKSQSPLSRWKNVFEDFPKIGSQSHHDIKAFLFSFWIFHTKKNNNNLPLWGSVYVGIHIYSLYISFFSDLPIYFFWLRNTK